MDAPEIRQVSALEQELENYRSTLAAVEARLAEVKAERDRTIAAKDVLLDMEDRAIEAEADRDEAIGVLAEEVKNFLVAKEEAAGWMREALLDHRRASRYRARLARVLQAATWAHNFHCREGGFAGTLREYGCVWSRRVTPRPDETRKP